MGPRNPELIASRTRSTCSFDRPGTRSRANRPTASGSRRLTTLRPASRTSIRSVLRRPPRAGLAHRAGPAGRVRAGCRTRTRRAARANGWPVGVAGRAGPCSSSAARIGAASSAVRRPSATRRRTWSSGSAAISRTPGRSAARPRRAARADGTRRRRRARLARARAGCRGGPASRRSTALSAPLASAPLRRAGRRPVVAPLRLRRRTRFGAASASATTHGSGIGSIPALRRSGATGETGGTGATGANRRTGGTGATGGPGSRRRLSPRPGAGCRPTSSGRRGAPTRRRRRSSVGRARPRHGERRWRARRRRSSGSPGGSGSASRRRRRR